MKTQRERSGGRILLGDNTGGKAVMLRPISFQYAGVWISISFRVHHSFWLGAKFDQCRTFQNVAVV